ncbi:FAS1 domain-containing protein [Panus rudis PR-1116 ss-1]|nr:FAS1 domain-containing protein [Panus rudis PR-1116 ss-1]
MFLRRFAVLAVALAVCARPEPGRGADDWQDNSIDRTGADVQWRFGFEDAQRVPHAQSASQVNLDDAFGAVQHDEEISWTPHHGPPAPPEFPPHTPPKPPMRPPHPPPPHGPRHPRPNVENKTIYQALKDEESFSRLFKFVNLTDEIIEKLNDTKASVTFFAVPNWALRPPKRPKDDDELERVLARAQGSDDLLDNFAVLEGVAQALATDQGKDDEHKKEILKKIVRAVLSYHILPSTLSVEDLAKNSTYETALKKNDGSFDGEVLRVRSVSFFKAVFINFFSRIVEPDIKALNGLIHLVNHPVFPPGSVFQNLFFFTESFSIFTSAIQRVGLSDAIEWHYVPGEGDSKGTLEGSPAVTVFAPSNKAFKKLPPDLRAFLFTPFGERALKKLLQFHIVPEYILHSDWSHNATDSLYSRNTPVADDALRYIPTGQGLANGQARHCHQKFRQNQHAFPPHPPTPHFPHHDDPHHPPPPPPDDPHHPPPPPDGPHHPPPHLPHHKPHPEPVYSVNITLPTLLTNHTLNIHISQFEHRLPLPHHPTNYVTKVFANGIPVSVPDGVARNGAVHGVGRILDPRGPKKHHGPGGPHGEHDASFNVLDEKTGEWYDAEWQGWQDWFVKWAEED